MAACVLSLTQRRLVYCQWHNVGLSIARLWHNDGRCDVSDTTLTLVFIVRLYRNDGQCVVSDTSMTDGTGQRYKGCLCCQWHIDDRWHRSAVQRLPVLSVTHRWPMAQVSGTKIACDSQALNKRCATESQAIFVPLTNTKPACILRDTKMALGLTATQTWSTRT